MFRMALGHSDDVDATEASRSALAQCADALAGATPKAGVIVSTHEADPPGLVEQVIQRYPDIELIGSTSAAEMSSVLGFQEGSILLALFASDTVDMTVGLGAGIDEDPRGAAREAVKQALSRTSLPPRLCITFPGPSPDPTVLQEGLREALGEGVAIIGGISSATLADPGAANQFSKDTVVHDGVPVLLFSGPLSYSFGVDNGWRPVGKKATVTRASDSVVQEIDGRPAVEFYERYLGSGGKPAPASPLAVFEDGSDDFYLRVVGSYDESTGSIQVVGGLPEGSTVQLSVAVTDEIFAGVRSAARKARQAYPPGSDPEAALIVSCMIRKLLLGSRTAKEIDIIREELGETVPVCGFYSYGELAPIQSGANQLHNETIVALLLGSV